MLITGANSAPPDGYAVVRAVRAGDFGGRVLIFSAAPRLEECRACGADAVATKPLTLEALGDVVRQVLDADDGGFLDLRRPV